MANVDLVRHRTSGGDNKSNSRAAMTGHRLFDFRHTADAGVHTYSCSASVTLEAVWPGLWEQEYPRDSNLNPYLRFGINNGDGEPQAVWRAFAWASTIFGAWM